jgi:hypothetical protein
MVYPLFIERYYKEVKMSRGGPAGAAILNREFTADKRPAAG